MHVIATAGHVDHGKSTLVRALTGMEPDRWAEERRRGMTIDLGFVWTRLPDGEEIAFVDVPGHERFVPNMLAGVGPVPAVMMVVAADEGWRAQSEEHLAAIDALGIRHGLLAVTRSDLADPAPARAEALARMAASSLGDVEAVTVSGATGEGLDELRCALGRLVTALPAPDPDADVRLWVDRAFTIRGRGTVVTGTLGAGRIRVGDELVLAASGRRARVRALQTLRRDQDEVAAVARVAVNLRGVDVAAVARGDALLTPGRWLTTDVADVRLRVVPARDAPEHLTLHVGSAAVPVRLRPLGDDTARLGLRAPLPLRIGDTALLRDPGQHRVVAGLTVLDVRPPKLARRGAAAARARELAEVTGVPDGAGELRRRGLVRRADLIAMGAAPPAEPVARDWLADPRYWADLRRRLARVVAEHAARHPQDPGLPVDAARHALGLPDSALVNALAGPPLHLRGGRVFGEQCVPRLPPAARAAVETLRRELTDAPFRAPDARRLAELGLTPRLLAAVTAAGALLRIADGIVLLPGADAEAARRLAALGHPFTASEARRALGTTRRVVIPLLEHLDRQGRTVRVDELRRRCPDD